MAVLNLAPINQSGWAFTLCCAAALVAALNPFTWVFYIAASQIVADPAGAPLTLGQLGILSWLLTLPANGCLNHIKDARPMLAYVGPLVAWYYFASLVMRQDVPTQLAFAVVTGLITCTYIRRPGINFHLLLLCLVLGTGYAVAGYLGTRLGVPVIAPTYDGGDFLRVARVGSGRGDSNTVGLNIPVLIVGTLALASFRRYWTAGRKWTLNIVAAVSLALGSLALMSTFSRGGLYSLPLGLLGFACIAAVTARSKRGKAMKILAPLGILCAGISVFVYWNGGASLDDVIQVLMMKNDRNERLSGGGVLSGRMDPWRTHIEMMMAYPIAGVPKGTTWYFREHSATVIGEELWSSAHNSFLEFGSQAGVPGLVLFLIVFFWAPWQLTRRRGIGFAGPFLAVMWAIFLGFLSLSAENWKTYWALLPIMIQACEQKAVRVAGLGVAFRQPTAHDSATALVRAHIGGSRLPRPSVERAMR